MSDEQGGVPVEPQIIRVLPSSDGQGEQVRHWLTSAGLAVHESATLLELADAIDEHTGALVLTDVAVTDCAFESLIRTLERQPDWSVVPVILLCAPDAPSAAVEHALAHIRNITLLEWPVSSRSLLSAVQAALHGRGLQLHMRAQLQAIETAEANLRESEGRFRTMANSIPQLAWMAHADGYIFWYNDRWYDYTGTTLEQMQGWGWRQVHDPEHVDRVVQKISACFESGMPWEDTFPLRARDGSYRWFLSRALPIRDARGEIRRWFGTNTDLTEQLSIEDALRTRERELKTLAENTPDIVARFDRQLRHVFVNPAVARATGIRTEDFIGRTNRELGLPEPLCEQWDDALREVFETGRPLTLDFSFNSAEQGRLDFENRLVPELGPDRSVQTVLCVAHDITASRRAEESLRNADRRKDEFMAMLAHELRNPLSPIRSATEVLTRILPGESKAQAPLAIVKRQVAHMTRLVDDLLDIARITQGRIELRRESVELGGVVEQALEGVEPQLREKQQRLHLAEASRPLHVSGDLTRLVQCVGNVLTNAVKYTDPRGEIRVSLIEEGSEALVRIEDNGPGIPPELLPYIFDPFAQSDRTLDRSQGGLGLGLSIVQRLIQMHGGRVTTSSGASGRGAVFDIRLPLVNTPARAMALAPSPGAGRMRILVVDDNQDAALSLAQILQLDGHEAEAVFGAQQALYRASELMPHVVLLDIGLPELDGYEVARRLQVKFPEAWLIALTGYGQHEDIERARRAGFRAHLTKPVDFDALHRVLSEASAVTSRAACGSA